ncbi:hypothetical protein HYFRA_00001852 [Hymenoscyphus fraxineus]|uniref:Uncharacterized protein n=1 Tax=Hymenoscyphus fraxineus TaxID=746836 RepID=A0A9N9KKS3_9HELO|nr:hypothetical protein HYFRA_00001852 [Hymenoscyphus fraxineus]
MDCMEATALFSKKRGGRGFDEDDEKFRVFFQAQLRQIAQHSSQYSSLIFPSVDRLWCGMVGYYLARNEAYLDKLVKNKIMELLPQPTDTSYQLYKLIKEIKFLIDSSNKSSAFFSELILKAQKIARYYGVDDFTNCFPSDCESAKTLSCNIAFLARLREGWEVIVQAACKFTSIFSSIVITPIDHKTTHEDKISSHWDLRTTLKSLSWLDFGTATDIDNVLLQPDVRKLITNLKGTNDWEPEDIKKSFQNHQMTPPQHHCEIQLLTEASMPQYTDAKLFGYMGCSKWSCYSCHLFMEAHQRFQTDGTHHEVVNGWMVPHEKIDFEKEMRQMSFKLMPLEMSGLKNYSHEK